MWVNQEVVATARTQLYYRPGGPEQGKFCDWFGRNANWCAMGTSWSFYETFGDEMAKKIIGVQSDAPYKRGWSWTVGLREWLQDNGTKIPIAQARAGDLLFFKYPASGDRANAPVNHVEIVVGVEGIYITTIGFNTAEPGKADILTNRGVYQVTYSIYNARLVDAYRPAYDRYPGIGYMPNGKTVDQIQESLAITPTGIYDENTRKEVERLQKRLNEEGFALEVDGLWGWGTNAAFDTYMATVQTGRLAGASRYNTAVEVSKKAWPKGAKAVYLVRGNDFPDALSIAGSLQTGSSLTPGPVLLVRDTLPDVVAAEIARLRPTEIYAVGGNDVVPDAVVRAAARAATN